MDQDISKLEYLDWVVRETLRFHAPVTWTMRVATEDDEIPVQQPFRDKYGELNATIKVSKHDILTIPIQAINKSYSIWGQDAHIFRYIRDHPGFVGPEPHLISGAFADLNGG